MVVAHNGENHSTEGNTAGASDEHAGHVQGSTSQEVSFSESDSSNNQQVLFIGGTALLVLAAAVAVWVFRSRKAAPAVVESSTQ